MSKDIPVRPEGATVGVTGIDLSEREALVLRALPDPAYSGMTGVQLVARKGVSPYPEIHRLIELGLARRRGTAYFVRTRAGVMWLREQRASRPPSPPPVPARERLSASAPLSKNDASSPSASPREATQSTHVRSNQT